jgi:hypothetical protein
MYINKQAKNDCLRLQCVISLGTILMSNTDLSRHEQERKFAPLDNN